MIFKLQENMNENGAVVQCCVGVGEWESLRVVQVPGTCSSSLENVARSTRELMLEEGKFFR